MEIIKIATASIPEEIKDARVMRVNLMVGKLSAVMPDSLRFCFEIAGKDTPLAGAELVIEEIPVRIRCRACQFETMVDTPMFQCRECGGDSVEIISGRELDIRSIEIEEKNT